MPAQRSAGRAARDGDNARSRGSRDLDALGAHASRRVKAAPLRRTVHPRTRGSSVAETVTQRTNRFPINGLAHACSGYPQACQHFLWRSDGACGESTSRVVRSAACSSRRFANRLIAAHDRRSMRCDAMRCDAMRFASRSLQQGSGEPRVVGARPRALPAHDRQTLCDQYVGVVAERFSTSLPTQSVDKEPVAYVRPPSEHARRRAYAGAARRIELGGSERPVGDPHGNRRCAPPCRSCRGRALLGSWICARTALLSIGSRGCSGLRQSQYSRSSNGSRNVTALMVRIESCSKLRYFRARQRDFTIVEACQSSTSCPGPSRICESSSKRSARAGSCPFGTRADREDSADERHTRAALECAPCDRTPLSYLSNAAPCRVGAAFGFAYSDGPSS